MVTRFWRPFLGGIFFDNELNTTDRLLTFVMRCLATGSNCLPAAGIGAVAEQLAAALPPGAVRTGARVAALTSGSGGSGEPAATLTLSGADGGVVTARRAVVVAVEGPEAGTHAAARESAPSTRTSHVLLCPSRLRSAPHSGSARRLALRHRPRRGHGVRLLRGAGGAAHGAHSLPERRRKRHAKTHKKRIALFFSQIPHTISGLFRALSAYRTPHARAHAQGW
jgi:hypothetical protein